MKGFKLSDFYPAHARAIFDDQKPACAECGAETDVSYDDCSGQWLCGRCGWPAVEKDAKKEARK